MKVRLDQLVPIKRASTELPKIVKRLESGDGPIILTKHGRPVASMYKIRPEDRGNISSVDPEPMGA